MAFVHSAMAVIRRVRSGVSDSIARTAAFNTTFAATLSAGKVGALSRPRELEAIGFLQLTLGVNEKVSWTGGFGVVA